MNNQEETNRPKEFVEGKHYYFEKGLMVFTELYHKERGYCCKNKCKHCPFKKKIK